MSLFEKAKLPTSTKITEITDALQALAKIREGCLLRRTLYNLIPFLKGYQDGFP